MIGTGGSAGGAASAHWAQAGQAQQVALGLDAADPASGAASVNLDGALASPLLNDDLGGVLGGPLGWDSIGWLAGLLLMGLWMLGAHNRLTTLRGAILAAWAPLEAVLQARETALTGLLAAAHGPLTGEQAALDAVAHAVAQVRVAADALRRQPMVPAAAAELSKADAVLAAVNQRFLALLSHQRELQAEPGVQAHLAALTEQQPRLQFARQAFNEAGLRYNAALAQFPTRLLAPVFRFEPAGQL